MKKTIVSLGAALTLSMAVLAGCQSGTEETTAAETTAAETTAAETEESTEAEAEESEESQAEETEAAAEYQYVSPEDAVQAAQDGSAHVLDVREWSAYVEGRVANSLWCPIFPLDDESLVEPMAAFAETNLNDGQDIYLICVSGQKGAQRATGVLTDAGIDPSLIYTVEGGATALAEVDGALTTNRAEENIEWQYVPGTDAVAALGSDEVQFLDVRDDETYAAGHLDGSLQVNLQDFETPEAQTAMYTLATEELDPSKPVYILCYSGNNCAKTAISVMKDAGFDVSNLFIIENGAKDADVQAAFVQ